MDGDEAFWEEVQPGDERTNNKARAVMKKLNTHSNLPGYYCINILQPFQGQVVKI
jgi:hypothetical protein